MENLQKILLIALSVILSHDVKKLISELSFCMFICVNVSPPFLMIQMEHEVLSEASDRLTYGLLLKVRWLADMELIINGQVMPTG